MEVAASRTFCAALLMYHLSMPVSCRVAGFLLGKSTPISHCTQKNECNASRMPSSCIQVNAVNADILLNLQNIYRKEPKWQPEQTKHLHLAPLLSEGSYNRVRCHITAYQLKQSYKKDDKSSQAIMEIISTALQPNQNLGYGYLSEIRTAFFCSEYSGLD